MNSKAIRKQLLAAVAMVLVAAVALGSSTYAWFAANRTVKATDMQVSATSSTSLIIANSVPTASDTATSVSATTTATVKELVPARHDETVGTTAYLKYNTNPDQVDASTGLQETGKDALTFADAVNGTKDTDPHYYVDYVVYIAVAGAALSNQDLTISLSADKTGGNLTDTLSASSIDFYVETVDTAAAPVDLNNYKGTLNMAGKDATTNNGTATKTQFVVSGVNIPVNTASSGYLRVTMRVYIDGGLLKAPAQAYVYSNKVDTSSIKLVAQFDAANHSGT